MPSQGQPVWWMDHMKARRPWDTSLWALQMEMGSWSPASFVLLETPFNVTFTAVLFPTMEASKELQKFTKKKKSIIMAI